VILKRRGEKWGWIGGWLGGFIWVVILSILLLVQGKAMQGIGGLVVVGVAVVVIIAMAPWRHQSTPYWKLMLPVYIMFFGSVAWALWAYDGTKGFGLGRGRAFLILPLLLPFATAGRKRWSDSYDM